LPPPPVRKKKKKKIRVGENGVDYTPIWARGIFDGGTRVVGGKKKKIKTTAKKRKNNNLSPFFWGGGHHPATLLLQKTKLKGKGGKGKKLIKVKRFARGKNATPRWMRGRGGTAPEMGAQQWEEKKIISAGGQKCVKQTAWGGGVGNLGRRRKK